MAATILVAELDRHLAARRGNLDARARLRDHFAGIRSLKWIEHVAQLGHDAKIVGREHQSHLADFFDADSVLAGEAAAHLDARFQDFTARVERATDLIGFARRT